MEGGVNLWVRQAGPAVDREAAVAASRDRHRDDEGGSPECRGLFGLSSVNRASCDSRAGATCAGAARRSEPSTLPLGWGPGPRSSRGQCACVCERASEVASRAREDRGVPGAVVRSAWGGRPRRRHGTATERNEEESSAPSSSSTVTSPTSTVSSATATLLVISAWLRTC